ncbi:light-mediated development protein DET1 isoform X1 [Gossypium hirsutum]|uniref:Light-mediated development protein DET1 isoform X1 n=1 Tax=Gossypium hirsutum TaxID=3635 RepID=A0ABM2ZVZ3_GOSHI|nr:light-mediated development protein DET1-like isoform X1 [Gossypium hirsutum]
MFKTNNVASRIFERQIRTPAPGTSVHSARRFYENLVPSFTIYDVECPDHSFFKFTDDGQYFVCFSRNRQDLIVYRPTWLSFSCKGEDCDNNQELPPQAKRFESFFTQLYVKPLASCNELICKDFFLYMESNQYGIFATSTAQIQDARGTDGAILGVPSFEKITIHLFRLEDGFKLDEKVFHNDCVNLTHNMGAFLYDDLLAVVSLRYQTIHILQIRDSGNLVDVRAIGAYCREDDELFLNSSSQLAGNRGDLVDNGTNHDQPNSNNSFLSGIKQRLLSFIFREIWSEETDQTQRVQCLKKKFYFHFQDYVDLVILKVQFLDRHHLLIKFGSVDVGASRNTDQLPAFFAVYNMETTEIVAFYQNAADELYLLFERFCDHFHATSINSMYMNFISSHSNNIYALEQLKSMKNKATSVSQVLISLSEVVTSLPFYSFLVYLWNSLWIFFLIRILPGMFVKKMLSSLPLNCQSMSPSPYFDQSLFRFDEKLISATDRPRQSTDHPIRFISRRQPNILKFKIKTGPEFGGADGRSKKYSHFLFHPAWPLALSFIQPSLFLPPSAVNIHFRR